MQKKFAQGLDLEVPDKLNREDLAKYNNLVVVGHRSEFDLNQQKSLAGLVKGSGCRSLVLAMCHSAMGETKGTLGDNDLWTTGQRMANLTGVPVMGTLRILDFDEVGKGEAFVLSQGVDLTVKEPFRADGSRLWQEFHPQSDLDTMTEGIGRL